MEDYVRELQQLGIELKDYFTGLIDFPSLMDGTDGLPVLAAGRSRGRRTGTSWNAGFAGRQKLMPEPAGSERFVGRASIVGPPFKS